MMGMGVRLGMITYYIVGRTVVGKSLYAKRHLEMNFALLICRVADSIC